ncbi:MAG TPA: hypothetical protein VFV46_06235 [Lacibacter sp.]|nr:hypothetical protein [Lacibacter sp.]
MMRLLFISLLILAGALLFLQGRLNIQNDPLPVFLKTDELAQAHQTKIDIKVNSIHRPDSVQLSVLKKDYSNLWAHLNYLYQSNDVESGKEYYTEAFFKQINHHYSGVLKSIITRTDVRHELHIQNWAWDGLACTAIDSNVVLQYQLNGKIIKTTKVNLAIVLLYQGNHWRLDALRIINEK